MTNRECDIGNVRGVYRGIGLGDGECDIEGVRRFTRDRFNGIRKTR